MLNISTRLFFQLFLAFSLITIHPLVAQQRTTVLICESPENLVLFNRYQQQLSYDEIRLRLKAYTPFFVEERQTLLNDELTTAIKTRYNNQLFFIGLNEKGEILQRSNSNIEIYTDCETIFDTAVVLHNNAVWVQSGLKPQQADKNQRFFLSAGDKVIRLFKWKRFVYVQTTGGIPIFGWSNLSNARQGQLWEPPHIAEIPKSNSAQNNLTFDDVEQFTRQKLEEANKVLQALFEHFNRQFQRDLLPPQWTIRSAPPLEIICELTNAPPDNRFNESTRYLFFRIENYLLKSDYTVKLEGNRIIIYRKNL